MSADEKSDAFDQIAQILQKVGEKENPAEATAGLSGNSDQTDELTFTGEQFFEAFCIIVQARFVVRDLHSYANLIAKGRTFDSFGADELDFMRERLRDSETIYRELYRSRIRIDFRRIFRLKKWTFEEDIIIVQRFFGGE